MDAKSFYSETLTEQFSVTEIGKEAVSVMVQGAMKSSFKCTWRNARNLVNISKNGTLTKILKEIKVPKIYFIGERNLDQYINQTEMLTDIGFEIRIIKSSGHVMMFENPLEVAVSISSFIESS